MKYKCESCGAEKDIFRLHYSIQNGRSVCEDARCECGDDMISKDKFEGYGKPLSRAGGKVSGKPKTVSPSGRVGDADS